MAPHASLRDATGECRRVLVAVLMCTGAEKGKLDMAGDPLLGRLRDRCLLGATSLGARGKLSTGVRWWCKFCVHGRGVSPIRMVDESSSRADKLADEQLLMDFVVWLVACRPSGRTVKVKTAMKYVSEVQGWASRLSVGGGRIGGGLSLDRLKGLATGMERLIGESVRTPRFGVRTQDLAEAMRMLLSGGSAAEANWRAALTTAFCALMRGGEIGVSDSDTWCAEIHLTRADVTFYRDAGGVLFCILMMRPLKKKPGMRKSVPVVLKSGGSLIDPVAELWELFQRDPLKKGERPDRRPLFRNPANGAAFKVSDVRSVVKWMMAKIGLDPKRFGAHSLRIGGATAALAAGVSPAQIRLLGRWSSDVAELYMQMTQQSAGDFSTIVGSTAFDDIERHTFKTEELEILPVEWNGLANEPDLFDQSDDDSS